MAKRTVVQRAFLAAAGIAFPGIALSFVGAPMIGETVRSDIHNQYETNSAVVPANSANEADDPLDKVLNRAGLKRSDLGVSPKGWWSRYPRAPLHKLDHFDDIMREPLTIVPFTRTIASAVREYLGQNGLAVDTHGTFGFWTAHSLYRLVSTAVSLRYGDIRVYTVTPRGAAPALDQAVLQIYRSEDEETSLVTYNVKSPETSIEPALQREASQISPEVSHILGQLVLDILDAHRDAALAFRKIPLEQRRQIVRLAKRNLGGMMVYAGLGYEDLSTLDDASKLFDEGSLWDGGLKCVEALDRARRALLALPKQKLALSKPFQWETPWGWIRVFGTGDDVIDASDGLLTVDLGGNDHWHGSVGASSETRLISVALDLSGNDTYEGDDVTQGAGVAGIGILMDAAGNDKYVAKNFAQGAALLGMGLLVDLGGNDRYQADYNAQGAGAFIGIGMLADAAGDDQYKILADGQGFAGAGAVGILADRSGNDFYYAPPNAKQSGRSSYGTESSASFVQGVGVGKFFGPNEAHTWAGGIGALVDIEGNDQYEAGSWAQGTGYWFGTGMLYDGAGDDHYKGGENWTQASAAHYGIGVLVDEGGSDFHLSNKFSLGAAHDVSVALFLSGSGNSSYTFGEYSAGYTRDRGVAGMFIDAGGDDTYKYTGAGSYLPGTAAYDPNFRVSPDGTGTVTDMNDRVIPPFAYMTSVALFLDAGGNDKYWGALKDGSEWGDRAGSQNWKVRNLGIGADIPSGIINWDPRLNARAP